MFAMLKQYKDSSESIKFLNGGGLKSLGLLYRQWSMYFKITTSNRKYGIKHLKLKVVFEWMDIYAENTFIRVMSLMTSMVVSLFVLPYNI